MLINMSNDTNTIKDLLTKEYVFTEQVFHGSCRWTCMRRSCAGRPEHRRHYEILTDEQFAALQATTGGKQ